MNLIDDLRQVLQTLEAERIPHMVVGGLALDALGIPRATVDLDVQVAMDPPPTHQPVVLNLLVDEHATDEVFGQHVVVAHVPASGIPVELFLTTHWLPRQALDRRQTVESHLLARAIPIPAPEDFLLLKSAYRVHPSRSPRKAAQDGVDLEAVATMHRDRLDMDYLEENARRLGTWSTLEPLLR